MRVTGALLAEAATAADGKLFVLGGVLNSWTRQPGQPATPVLIILTQAEPNDTTAEVPLTVFDSNGNEVASLKLPVPPITLTGDYAGFFSQHLQLAVPDGRCVILVGEGSDTVSLPIEIRTTS